MRELTVFSCHVVEEAFLSSSVLLFNLGRETCLPSDLLFHVIEFICMSSPVLVLSIAEEISLPSFVLRSLGSH